MIPAAFAYHRAASVEDALSRLAASNGAAKFIAGGHSLVPMMKMRLAQPEMLIDIARLSELAGVRELDGRIEIGACTTHYDLASSSIVRTLAPAITDAAEAIGDPQVRHRGTISGSIAHADPAADYPAVLLALEAEIAAQGRDGQRRIKAADFFRDLFTVDLRPDELIVSISVSPARASAYAKLHQRASKYAIVGVAAALQISDGVVRSARVGITGAGSHAGQLTGVESALAGKPATAPSIGAAAADAGAALSDVSSDLHASAEYRRAMVGVFAERALSRALQRAG